MRFLSLEACKVWSRHRNRTATNLIRNPRINTTDHNRIKLGVPSLRPNSTPLSHDRFMNILFTQNKKYIILYIY